MPNFTNNPQKPPETETLIEHLPFGVKMTKREHIRYTTQFHTRILGIILFVFYIILKIKEYGASEFWQLLTVSSWTRTYFYGLLIFAVIDYIYHSLSYFELTHNRLIIHKGFLYRIEIQLDEVSTLGDTVDNWLEFSMKKEEKILIKIPLLFGYSYLRKSKSINADYGTLVRMNHFLAHLRKSLYIKDAIGFIENENPQKDNVPEKDEVLESAMPKDIPTPKKESQ